MRMSGQAKDSKKKSHKTEDALGESERKHMSPEDDINQKLTGILLYQFL